MKSGNFWRILAGFTFLLIGGLAFLQTSGLVSFGKPSWLGLGLAVLGVSGLVFIVVMLSSPTKRWWGSIPGFSLLGLTAGGVLEFLPPDAARGLWPGSAVFIGIALGFWVVYIVRPRAWWAIIPAGAISSLAAMIVVSGTAAGELITASVFFLGLAATFGLLAVLPTHKHLVWPWVPAGSLLLLALFFYLAASEKSFWISQLWPGFLIVLGLFFLVRALIGNSDEASKNTNEANKT